MEAAVFIFTMALSPLALTGLVVVLPMAVVKWDLDEPQWVRTFPAHRTLAYSPLLYGISHSSAESGEGSCPLYDKPVEAGEQPLCLHFPVG